MAQSSAAAKQERVFQERRSTWSAFGLWRGEEPPSASPGPLSAASSEPGTVLVLAPKACPIPVLRADHPETGDRIRELVKTARECQENPGIDRWNGQDPFKLECRLVELDVGSGASSTGSIALGTSIQYSVRTAESNVKLMSTNGGKQAIDLGEAAAAEDNGRPFVTADDSSSVMEGSSQAPSQLTSDFGWARGHQHLGSTDITPDSRAAISDLLQAWVMAIDAIYSWKRGSVSILGRPPGHHGSDEAQGFCPVNSLAVNILYAVLVQSVMRSPSLSPSDRRVARIALIVNRLRCTAIFDPVTGHGWNSVGDRPGNYGDLIYEYPGATTRDWEVTITDQGGTLMWFRAILEKATKGLYNTVFEALKDCERVADCLELYNRPKIQAAASTGAGASGGGPPSVGSVAQAGQGTKPSPTSGSDASGGPANSGPANSGPADSKDVDDDVIVLDSDTDDESNAGASASGAGAGAGASGSTTFPSAGTGTGGVPSRSGARAGAGGTKASKKSKAAAAQQIERSAGPDGSVLFIPFVAHLRSVIAGLRRDAERIEATCASKGWAGNTLHPEHGLMGLDRGASSGSRSSAGASSSSSAGASSSWSPGTASDPYSISIAVLDTDAHAGNGTERLLQSWAAEMQLIKETLAYSGPFMDPGSPADKAAAAAAAAASASSSPQGHHPAVAVEQDLLDRYRADPKRFDHYPPVTKAVMDSKAGAGASSAAGASSSAASVTGPSTPVYDVPTASMRLYMRRVRAELPHDLDIGQSVMDYLKAKPSNCTSLAEAQGKLWYPVTPPMVPGLPPADAAPVDRPTVVTVGRPTTARRGAVPTERSEDLAGICVTAVPVSGGSGSATPSSGSASASASAAAQPASPASAAVARTPDYSTVRVVLEHVLQTVQCVRIMYVSTSQTNPCDSTLGYPLQLQMTDGLPRAGTPSLWMANTQGMLDVRVHGAALLVPCTFNEGPAHDSSGSTPAAASSSSVGPSSAACAAAIARSDRTVSCTKPACAENRVTRCHVCNHTWCAKCGPETTNGAAAAAGHQNSMGHTYPCSDRCRSVPQPFFSPGLFAKREDHRGLYIWALNLPFQVPRDTARVSATRHLYAMREIIGPALAAFQPDLLINANGEDVLSQDQVGRHDLTPADHGLQFQVLNDYIPGTPIIDGIEGGYGKASGGKIKDPYAEMKEAYKARMQARCENAVMVEAARLAMATARRAPAWVPDSYTRTAAGASSNSADEGAGSSSAGASSSLASAPLPSASSSILPSPQAGEVRGYMDRLVRVHVAPRAKAYLKDMKHSNQKFSRKFRYSVKDGLGDDEDHDDMVGAGASSSGAGSGSAGSSSATSSASASASASGASSSAAYAMGEDDPSAGASGHSHHPRLHPLGLSSAGLDALSFARQANSLRQSALASGEGGATAADAASGAGAGPSSSSAGSGPTSPGQDLPFPELELDGSGADMDGSGADMDVLRVEDEKELDASSSSTGVGAALAGLIGSPSLMGPPPLPGQRGSAAKRRASEIEGGQAQREDAAKQARMQDGHAGAGQPPGSSSSSAAVGISSSAVNTTGLASSPLASPGSTGSSTYSVSSGASAGGPSYEALDKQLGALRSSFEQLDVDITAADKAVVDAEAQVKASNESVAAAQEASRLKKAAEDEMEAAVKLTVLNTQQWAAQWGDWLADSRAGGDIQRSVGVTARDAGDLPHIHHDGCTVRPGKVAFGDRCGCLLHLIKDRRQLAAELPQHQQALQTAKAIHDTAIATAAVLCRQRGTASAQLTKLEAAHSIMQATRQQREATEAALERERLAEREAAAAVAALLGNIGVHPA